VEIGPFISGFFGFNLFQIYGSVQYIRSLEDEEHAHTPGGVEEGPNFVSPHADKDFFFLTGAAYHFTSRLYVNGILRFEFPQDGELDGKTLTTLYPEIAWQKTRKLWIVLGGEVSLSSDNWYDHGINLKFRWRN